MKRNEIIELNGQEYTLELNRESFVAIDQHCNINKSMEIIQRSLYDYKEEVEDDYDPFASIPSDEEIEKEVLLKEETLDKIIVRSFHVWLYPNYKLSLTQVRELVKPYLEDKEKAEWIGQKLGEYLKASVEIKQQANEERKNLIAQANK